MKLRKSIHSINTKFYNKFEDCDPKKIVRGDYIHVKYKGYENVFVSSYLFGYTGNFFLNKYCICALPLGVIIYATSIVWR